MAWLEWLNKLEKVLEISGDVLSKVVNINITKTVTHHHYHIDKRTLHVNPDKLTLEQQQQLQEALKEAEQDGELLFDTSKSKVLEDAVNYYDGSEEDQRLLRFFEDLIPSQDLKALEESLFLRYEFKKKKNIDGLKREIRNKYGQRGNNIANLCTAEYFHEDLQSIYNEYGLEFFKKIYHLMVGREAFTLFVSQEMNVQETTQKIEEALKQAKRYGVEIYQIHGIGKKNIKKIEDALKKLKGGETKFAEKNVYRETNPPIVIVELIL